MNINQIIHGFKVENISVINNLNIEAYEMVHILSGAKVIYLKCDDKNCFFTIGFKTIPTDSTGVFHILEHSVLNGSKKYPVKEPFVYLLKTTLASYLNALTASHWTMYPFASQTPKDFDNLLSVYLDAVFAPLCIESPCAFLQEGWHYEIDEDGNLSYNGVVYNEMKGATSTADDILNRYSLAYLFKDTSLFFDSGGDPEEIPNLSYDEYKRVYKKHYVPENSLSIFYGDLDIESKLKFMNEEYFSKYKKTGQRIDDKIQTPFIDLNCSVDFPLGEDQEIKDNTYMSLNYALPYNESKKDIMAFSIVMSTLLSNDNAPLRKRLMDKKLGKSIYYSFDSSYFTPFFQLFLNQTNSSVKEEFYSEFVNGVKYFVENGIDKELLLATINIKEFSERENDSGHTPKGLLYAFSIMYNYVFDNELYDGLDSLDLYKELKEELSTSYFEDILKRYILDSNHHVLVTCNPSKTLLQKRQKELKEKLLDIKNNMSKSELEEIKRLNKQLSEYQEKENTHEDLKHLPSLSIKDIPSDMPCIKTILDKNSPYKALYKHKIDTRKIAYLRAYFDLSKLTIDELVYLTIFRWLTFETKTKKYSASDLNKYIRIHLGDLAFGMLNQSRSKDKAKLYFTIDASSLEGNIKYIPHFINEIIFNSLPSKKDVDRILKKQISRLKTNINNGSTPLAILEAESQISSEAKLDFEVIKGRKLLIKIIEISKNVSFKEIKNNINKVIEKVFTKDNAIFFIACDKKVYTKLKKSLNKFKLSEKHFDDALSINIDNNEHKRAFVIPSNVNYNAAVKSLEDYSLKYCGKFLVLSHILNLTYLWENVRVKGGAYGTGFSVKPNNTMIFSSYRDPNVKTTFETFSKVGDF